MKYILGLLLFTMSTQVFANEIVCGQITQLRAPGMSDELSARSGVLHIRIEHYSQSIPLQFKMEAQMALAAYTTKEPVLVHIQDRTSSRAGFGYSLEMGNDIAGRCQAAVNQVGR